MGKTKQYWTGIDELENTPAFQESQTNEFASTQTVDEFLSDDRLKETNTGRRDFLKFLGFSVTAATLASCETPVVKSIPYVNKPETITPGVANWYASTYYDGHDYGNVLVKTREGRPIFLKGNKDHGIASGAVNSRINASVLSLYDSARLQGPRIGGEDKAWADVDAGIAQELKEANGATVVLSNTIISPSSQRAIDEFTAVHGGRHIAYDEISYSAISKAHNNSHGAAVVPFYDFSKARTIVSIGCDFLGSWMCTNLFAAQYGQTRKPEGGWMSKHYQFETIMSLTGSNADVRCPVKVSEQGKVAAAIHAGVAGGTAPNLDEKSAAVVAAAVADLKKTKGESLVVAGSNDPNIQIIVNAINASLNNYGTTINVDQPVNMYRGSDAAMTSLIADMKGGKVKALIVYGCNPSYGWHDAAGFNEGLAKVKTTISFNGQADETASKCKYNAPDHHFLESWNDLSAMPGRVDLVQPTISPLFKTRQAQESLLVWAGNTTGYQTYMRQTHNPGFDPDGIDTDKTWYEALHNGTMARAAATPAETEPELDSEAPAPTGNVSAAITAVNNTKGGDWELEIYSKAAIGAGNHTTNPWCQELPDPVTKVVWDNYVTMSPADCKEMGFNTTLGQRDHAGEVKVTAGDQTVTLPVFALPGQKRKTIGIARGYGRGGNGEQIGKAALQVDMNGEFVTNENGHPSPVGANAMPFARKVSGHVVTNNLSVNIENTGEEQKLASTQMHNTIMGRDGIVKETTLDSYLKEKDAPRGKASWNEMVGLVVHEDVNEDGKINAKDKKDINNFDLWHAHPVENVGHRWGMSIDLNSCIGCGSCITACHIENNVPVVGKDEVHRHRDMHWMRIDRFFSSEQTTLEATKEATGQGMVDSYRTMEDPAENPQTVHMPMMCQHCNHAPCETVCPVAATTHSNEGLNQMAYNRCIGTRYCANNCPYKVRRFNWFDYTGNKKFQHTNPSMDSLTRMVLNPDVTVRTRGVMEKCSMCVQRIQHGKLDAKKAGETVADGSIQTACAEACPTHAINFGDFNDKSSVVKSKSDNNRAYNALEEVGVKPNIYYMTKVRNNQENEA